MARFTVCFEDLKANFIAKNAMRVFITRVDLNDIFKVHHIRLLWMQWSGNAATDINDRDDEYAEQDFGVEDAADNDEYADKNFENLVKQFRVDEKMCYYPFPKCGINVPSLRAFIVLRVDMRQRGSSNELHVEIEPVIDKDAFIHITSYPEDVYFPEDCGIHHPFDSSIPPCSTFIISSKLGWKSELLGHLGSTALKYCRICMADKNDL
eukprot:Em0001g1692a